VWWGFEFSIEKRKNVGRRGGTNVLEGWNK